MQRLGTLDRSLVRVEIFIFKRNEMIKSCTVFIYIKMHIAHMIKRIKNNLKA